MNASWTCAKCDESFEGEVVNVNPDATAPYRVADLRVEIPADFETHECHAVSQQ